MPELSLIINGQEHKGWKEIRVTRSLEAVAHSFELELAEAWSGSNSTRSIKAGESCEIKIDNDLVTTGYIDIVQPTYDNSSHSIKVTGRSKVADLIDCSGLTKQFKNQSLFSIAQSLCKPFDISVVNNTGAFSNIKQQTIDAGESFYAFLERIARYTDVFFTSAPIGNLVMEKVGTKSAGTDLVLGQNVKAATGNFDVSQRFSEYTVYGQEQQSQGWDAKDAIRAKATVKDPLINRYRPIVFQNDEIANSTQCKQRATWQRNAHYGRSKEITYTVLGWSKLDGKLWQPNELVNVQDNYQGINDELLITTVALILDDQGQRTEITVQPKEAFTPENIKEPKPSTSGGW